MGSIFKLFLFYLLDLIKSELHYLCHNDNILTWKIFLLNQTFVNVKLLPFMNFPGSDSSIILILLRLQKTDHG